MAVKLRLQRFGSKKRPDVYKRQVLNFGIPGTKVRVVHHLGSLRIRRRHGTESWVIIIMRVKTLLRLSIEHWNLLF